jgi:hypothetical protein
MNTYQERIIKNIRSRLRTGVFYASDVEYLLNLSDGLEAQLTDALRRLKECESQNQGVSQGKDQSPSESLKT